MEGMMFNTSEGQIHDLKKGAWKIGARRIVDPQDDGLVNPDTLKQHCLESASLWVLKRRANLPNVQHRRLPAVARGS
jgi:hypothetical protein